MRASVIQLKQIVFQRIFVDAAEPTDGIPPIDAAGFDFEGVRFNVALDAGPAPGEVEDDPKTFVVALAVGIEETQERPTPYRIDVAALGLVEVSEAVDKSKRQDLALVNGGSLVYGAIRELVTTLTGRCIAGSLTLPTADFRDHSALLSPPAVQDTAPTHGADPISTDLL